MNLDRLKNINLDVNALMNIKPEDIRNFINEHQVEVFNAAVAVGALVIAVFLGNMRWAEFTQYNSRMQDLAAREEPVRKYEKTLKKTKELLGTIPSGLNEDDMVAYLTAAASRHQAVIVEFKPPSAALESFYTESRVAFSCTIPDFYEALAFIQELEASSHLVKVNAWSLVPQEQTEVKTRSRGQDKSGIRTSSGFLMKMDVSSLRLMENEKRKPKKQ